MVAKNSQSRCKEQDIPFFRFSPKFDEVIAAGETDNEKLFNLVVRTKKDLRSQQKELDELINIFQAVAESSQDLSQEPVKEEIANTISGSIQEEEEEAPDSSEQGGMVDAGEKEALLSPQESVKMKLERISTASSELKKISTASSELSKDVPITPHEVGQDLSHDDVFKDTKEEEDESISQLVESIGEENDSLLETKQEEFSGNFLFNSINGALKKRMSYGQEMDLLTDSPSPTEFTTDTKSPLSADRVAYTNQASPISKGQDHPRKTQSQTDVCSHNKSDIPFTQRSAQNLYKPYRTDTNEVDESHDEYTSYQRQTLV